MNISEIVTIEVTPIPLPPAPAVIWPWHMEAQAVLTLYHYGGPR